MSEFVKKTLMGYKEVPGGHSDSDCTHVILTLEEYDQQLQKISVAEQEARNTRYNANREIQQERSYAESQISAAKAAAAKEVEELKAELAAEQAESALQRGLNANLLRVARERANGERKLKPKKEHTGYVVVSSMEKEHRFKGTNQSMHTVMLWETVLETPYTVDFEVDKVKRLIEELFQKDESGRWMIQRIGINGNNPKGYANMIRDKDWKKDYPKYNVMLERRLKANYRTGYWEIIFQHTKPLASVPPDMRAR